MRCRAGVARVTPPTTEVLERDVAERARIDAALEVERRSIGTTIVIVVIAALMAGSAEHAAVDARVFELALLVVVPVAVVRLVLVARGRRLAPGSLSRALLVFGPLFVLVATWGALAAWGCFAARGTTLCTVIVATQCLCSAAVVVSYAGTPRLAVAIIVVTIVPTAVAVLFSGSADRISGPGALLFGVMLVSYLPRVARERRAGVISMLLLSARARSLEEARDAALAASAAKEAFFANLSHEIRTPLHGLLGTAERLKAMGLDGAQRSAVDQLYRCGQTLLGTLNDALDSTRLDSGKLQLRSERIVLPALLRDVVDVFADEARRKGLAMSLDADVTTQAIGDAQRVRQVLQNLVGNAVKFTDHGQVTVRARTSAPQGSAVELAVDVVDTGVGFTADERGRLFHRFSQLSTRAQGGSGLGLSISAELVHLMGGTIDATSDGPGRGACFRIRIPLTLHAGASAAVAGRRVLVVDDNPVNLAVACAYLEGLGVAVDAVGGGDEALSRSAAVRYDAILMDCNMPEKDGFATTRELRARGDTTPVLAITAASDGSTAQRCTEAGMEALVEKPVTAETLREALARVLVQRLD